MYIIDTEKLPIYVWATDADDATLEQARNLANHPHAFHHVSLMPDAHVGYGMPIGGVAAFKDVVCPYAVGADIACSMMAVRLSGGLNPSVWRDWVIANTFRARVKNNIPMGFLHNSGLGVTPHTQEARELLSKHPDVECEIITEEAVADQLGTLGGNNHFCEIQYDENEQIWLMIHCGSRNIGARLCTEYYRLAVQHCESVNAEVPVKHLSFLPIDNKEGQEYIAKMQFCMDFSHLNKEIILRKLLDELKGLLGEDFPVEEKYLIHHNFAALENHFGEDVWVHRKGATPASKETIGIIPGSMGSASYIVKGLDNVDSFSSCSHGAGRCMSRKQAKQSITLDQVRESMQGVIYDECEEILDEAPAAYKDIGVVMANQTGDDNALVEVVHTLTPLVNIKGTNPSRQSSDRPKSEKPQAADPEKAKRRSKNKKRKKRKNRR